MNGLRNCQFSLGSLLVVMTAVGVVMGMGRLVPMPDLAAVDPLVWWGLGMVGSVAAGTIYGIQWLNS